MLLYEDQLRKCVAFITAEVEDEDHPGTRIKKPVGTAFFASVRISGTNRSVLYAVTARHNVAFGRAAGGLNLRVNLEGGRATEISLPPDSWTVHPTTDVAAMRLDIPNGTQALTLPENLLLRDAHTFKSLFAAGDDVIIAALFVRHPGVAQNEPILRFGKISLLPKEPLSIEVEPGTFQSVPAVLIEAVSWGGQSGAPVFVDRSHVGGPGPFLLGLIHGHHELQQRIEIQGEVRGEVSMNAGVAIVIPAQAIFETLMDEHLARERQEIGERYSREAGQALSE